MKMYAAKAGIGHFHLHQFRHTFARIVAEKSGSLIETQHALGHKSLITTQHYVQSIESKIDKYQDAVIDTVRRKKN